MRIGVSINGVLRDFFGKIESTHEKYFPTEEDCDPLRVLDYDLDKWITFPEEEMKQTELKFNPNFSEKDDDQEVKLNKVNKKVTLHEFLYEKCTLEIFGYADEQVPGAVESLNKCILNYPNHEFNIISREIGLSIPSTLFFLSKTSSMCQNIKFVKEYKSVWDEVDLMVTDQPEIIKSKPKDKLCFIIHKDFNESCYNKHDLGIILLDSIKDLQESLQMFTSKKN